jgi:hypothetical protein
MFTPSDNVSTKLHAVVALGALLELDHCCFVVAQLLDAGGQVRVADALAEWPPAMAGYLGLTPFEVLRLQQ